MCVTQNLRKQPLLSFIGNIAHSCDNGLFVEDVTNRLDGESEGGSYEPEMAGEPIEARFEQLVAYKNYGMCAWVRGAKLVISDSRFIDNHIGAFTPST